MSTSARVMSRPMFWCQPLVVSADAQWLVLDNTACHVMPCIEHSLRSCLHDMHVTSRQLPCAQNGQLHVNESFEA